MSTSFSSSSVAFLAHKHRWLIAASLINYITYSSWTLLNKYQFSSSAATLNHHDHHHLNHHHFTSGLGTNCPVFSTGIQMLLAGSIACSVSILLHGTIFFALKLIKEQILPLGVARAIDIGCGNAALSLVSVALQQILKSLLPLFVCLLSYFVLGRNFSRKVWLALLPIIFGSLLAAWPSPVSSGHINNDHNMDAKNNHRISSPASPSPLASMMLSIGIALSLISTFGRSLKAVLNAKLLAGSKQSLPLAPLEVLSLEAPTSGLILLTGSLLVSAVMTMMMTTTKGRLFSSSPASLHHPYTETDSVDVVQSGNPGSSPSINDNGIMKICDADAAGFIRVNVVAGILMFFNQLSYITVIKLSSALSCQVLMNLKMLMLIMVSISLFSTPLSATNAFGMLVAFFGCILYAIVASEDEKNNSKKEFHVATSGGSSRNKNDNDDDDDDKNNNIRGHNNGGGGIDNSNNNHNSNATVPTSTILVNGVEVISQHRHQGANDETETPIVISGSRNRIVTTV